MQKILIAILTALFIVLFAEVGFYLWFKTPRNQSSSLPTIACITPTPFPNPAINPQTWRSFSVLHQGTVKSSLVATEFQGKVTELVFDKDGYAFKVRLLGSNNQSNAFMFLKPELPRLLFFQKDSQGKTTTMDINQLQLGDTVLYSEIVDLTKSISSNFVGGKIIKLLPI